VVTDEIMIEGNPIWPARFGISKIILIIDSDFSRWNGCFADGKRIKVNVGVLNIKCFDVETGLAVGIICVTGLTDKLIVDMHIECGAFDIDTQEIGLLQPLN
jgi:hypothetical protein